MSGLNISILILIISLQVCLLHAKSLGIESQQSAVIDKPGVRITNSSTTTTRTSDSSCTPDVSQLEYFNQFYSGATPNNSFSGNTMYYALRAMKIQTESETIAAEDDAIIASITDQSRFTPAGMDTANRIICARVLQELDAVATSISNTTRCGWDYVCDYKADRFPNYLFKARCRTSRCSGNYNQENNSHCRCLSHGIHVTVLRMRGNCGEWVWEQELLPIACRTTTIRTSDSSCTPDVSQLEYFNQLYSGATPNNSFSVNTMYYALRAMEIQTESAITAAEDDGIIASITDQSRFTPAGMDTANRIICARVLQELDAVATSISNTTLCRWDYVCDYKADRFPNYLFKARCRTSRCSGNYNQENNSHCRCLSHGIHVTVLRMRGNCGEWVWGQELLPIACNLWTF